LDSPLSTIVARAGGLHKLVSMTNLGMIAVARDSLMDESNGEGSSKAGASFETSSGRRLVGPAKYMEVVNACKPDLWASVPDEVPSWVNEKRNRLSVDRTLQWLDHCLSLQPAEYGNRCLGVVVGASSIEERIRSAEQTASRNVAGFSLGGFGLGEDTAQRAMQLEAVITRLPREKLRHVSGLGLPEEVLQAVGSGIDLFDSIYPYMLTKGGYAMTFSLNMENVSRSESMAGELAKSGQDSAKINLRSVAYKLDNTPLVSGCKCYTCLRHSRAYIFHLINTHEMLANTLLEIHNTYHYLEFFKAIRNSIRADKFHDFRDWFINRRDDRGSLSPPRKVESPPSCVPASSLPVS
jgi:queuine tRNA-ribosyltransferase subunit QTRTD1